MGRPASPKGAGIQPRWPPRQLLPSFQVEVLSQKTHVCPVTGGGPAGQSSPCCHLFFIIRTLAAPLKTPPLHLYPCPLPSASLGLWLQARGHFSQLLPSAQVPASAWPSPICIPLAMMPCIMDSYLILVLFGDNSHLIKISFSESLTFLRTLVTWALHRWTTHSHALAHPRTPLQPWARATTSAPIPRITF